MRARARSVDVRTRSLWYCLCGIESGFCELTDCQNDGDDDAGEGAGVELGPRGFGSDDTFP